MVLEFLTGVLVLVTAAYAVANFRMVRVMRDQLEQTMRPYITVSVLSPPKSFVLYLRIANTGRSAARELRLTIDKDFFRYGGKDATDNIARFNAFQTPIECFSPGAELIFALAQSFVLFGADADRERTPLVFNVAATYSYVGRATSETTTIDLRPYLSSNMLPDPALDVLERLEKAAAAMSRNIKDGLWLAREVVHRIAPASDPDDVPPAGDSTPASNPHLNPPLTAG